ncbi:hypothetical protein BJ138DRAFT_693690 [Hygrophoropsis aurantiaca]|uniref:Uncharacterized protein n=1 Tax=Hygrophoropsis aurantiaca TaxID=72124 RepID=A0ACB8ARR6_9AGAM|nr:hypothetical protein BJ138DRAFT_693690 [Hygrophoropsis aurantiaca]
MAFSNRTSDFRELLQAKQNALPPSKKRKVTPSDGDANKSDGFGKQYLTEAYTILNHINTLTRMLANVRKPYLSIESHSSPLSRQGSRTIDLADSQQSWSGIRHLTNEERDQIDLQTRVILTRCADRVKEMEGLEKRRAELVASKSNPLSRFLPARLKQDASSILSDFTAAHHSSITWYLNRRLAEASQTQKEMQEERVKRQLERTRTLGSSATREAMIIGTGEPIRGKEQPDTDSWLGGASSALYSGIAATIGAPTRFPTKPIESSVPLDDDDDDDDEIELSQSQILQFESENANILRSVQDTLESVQQAEARLMDISNLQMELVTHLTRQSELTDQLYEDAIATTSTAEKGNVQLREARRRAKDSRIFILVFLIGASLSLLFLHYY